MLNRRHFIQLAAAASLPGDEQGLASECRTPYKYGKLVLAGSGVKGDFDENLLTAHLCSHRAIASI